jgi:putative hydrolase of the HAD superfamily
MQQIKNIIFDFGGVVLDIDFSATQKAFEDLGVTDFDRYFTQHHVNDLFERFEIGAISPEEFFDEFREKTNLPLTDLQIENAWNAMILHFSKERMNRLAEIGKRYNTYLFSNTNKIHTDAFDELCKKEIGKPLKSFFIKTWYSHEIGMRKPYPASFLALLEKENLRTEETLFIDDTVENIDGARLSGLQTIHLTPPKTILDLDL